MHISVSIAEPEDEGEPVDEEIEIEMKGTPIRSNSIIDKKFMLVAKIKALEEYVEHLENTVAEQANYIEKLDVTQEIRHSRRHSI